MFCPLLMWKEMSRIVILAQNDFGINSKKAMSMDHYQLIMDSFSKLLVINEMCLSDEIMRFT